MVRFPSRGLVLFAGLGLLFAAGCRPQPTSLPQYLPEPGEPAVPDTRVLPIPTTTEFSTDRETTPAPPATAENHSPGVITPTLESETDSQVCLPISGLPPGQIGGWISNPFNPPPAGSDDPHQGIDLADMDDQRIARSGRTVQSSLDGQVAAAFGDRFPYGNAIMVETPLEDLPWLSSHSLPQPGRYNIQTALTCPQPAEPQDWNLGELSLYLLYAHLEEPVSFEAGEGVSCGQALGTVGDSGNALSPHLHLEARIGPSGARFESLSHYQPSATIEEMSAYCTWRVSGYFRTLDPLLIFSRGAEDLLPK